MGCRFELVWRNNELANPPGEGPTASPTTAHAEPDHAIDPPRKLAITWDGGGDVCFELESKGNDVLLTVIHRRLPDRKNLLSVSPGWHLHLDILGARMRETEPGPFWDGWIRLNQDYERRIPA